MAKLNAEQDYMALYTNLGPAQATRGDLATTIVSGIAKKACHHLGD